MEVPLKPVSRHCAHSGAVLQPGDCVISFLLKQPDGELVRMDVIEHAVDTYQLSGTEICRWRIVIRAKDDALAEARRQATLTAEELFISLCEQPEPAVESTQPDDATALRLALRQLLALQLERRRVLRCIDRATGRFRHVKSKQEYSVPNLEWDPRILLQLHDQLGNLLN